MPMSPPLSFWHVVDIHEGILYICEKYFTNRSKISASVKSKATSSTRVTKKFRLLHETYLIKSDCTGESEIFLVGVASTAESITLG